MANPSTAHEPSMEEILASIRQIISEDGEAAASAETSEREVSGSEFPPSALESSAAPETAPEDEKQGQGAFMKPQTRTNVHPIVSDQPSPDSARRDYASTAATPRAPIAPRQPIPEEAHLLSDQSDSAVSGAFSALAHTILAQNARTLEDLVAEMLKPMLKDWLDDNLPSLVERLVQEEIHRVSRGRR
jgi:uncharacterized protein